MEEEYIKVYDRPHHGALRAIINRVLRALAQYIPMPSNMRIFLHRLRGVKIGKGCYIGPDVFIDDEFPELLTLEDYVGLAAGVRIFCHERNFSQLGKNGIKYPRQCRTIAKPVTIKRGAAVYAYALILPGVTIGEGAIVAAGSVVTKDVPPFTVVAGNPAKPVRKTFESANSSQR